MAMELVVFDKSGDCKYEFKVETDINCMFLWMKLEEKYLPIYRPSYIPSTIKDEDIEEYLRYRPSRMIASLSLSEEEERKLNYEVWDLVFDKRLTKAERLVMATTFDRSLIKKEQLPDIIEAFKTLNEEYKLSGQIELLDRFNSMEDIIAVGWNQTTVNRNMWLYNRYDEENDTTYPYNCLKGDYHCWIIDILKEDGYLDNAI